MPPLPTRRRTRYGPMCSPVRSELNSATWSAAGVDRKVPAAASASIRARSSRCEVGVGLRQARDIGLALGLRQRQGEIEDVSKRGRGLGHGSTGWGSPRRSGGGARGTSAHPDRCGSVATAAAPRSLRTYERTHDPDVTAVERPRWRARREGKAGRDGVPRTSAARGVLHAVGAPGSHPPGHGARERGVRPPVRRPAGVGEGSRAFRGAGRSPDAPHPGGLRAQLPRRQGRGFAHPARARRRARSR